MSYDDYLAGQTLPFLRVERDPRPEGNPATGFLAEVLHANDFGDDALGPPQVRALRRALLVDYGRYLEAGISLSVLDDPGRTGDVFDTYSKLLSRILNEVYKKDSSVGNLWVRTGEGATPERLRDVLARNLLVPLSPLSDQIGRCLDEALMAKLNEERGKATSSDERERITREFMESDGLTWLTRELDMSCRESGFRYTDLLTKIRAVSGFGTTVWQYLRGDAQFTDFKVGGESANTGKAFTEALKVVNESLGDPVALRERFTEFAARTRTELFDSPFTRDRRERVPEALAEVCSSRWQYEDAANYRLGFGQVVQPEGVLGKALALELQRQLDIHGGVNGLPRVNAPIGDLGRPTTIFDTGLARMPDAFRAAGLDDALRDHRLEHGTGMNRWELYGMFAVEAAAKGLPSAGAQSGGTCDILLALSCLSPESLYGNRETVLPATVGISAFMNFGAYHTFAETFPIGQCMAEDTAEGNENVGSSRPRHYEPTIDERRADSLYGAFHQAVEEFAGEAAAARTDGYRAVYDILRLPLETSRVPDRVLHEATGAGPGADQAQMGDTGLPDREDVEVGDVRRDQGRTEPEYLPQDPIPGPSWAPDPWVFRDLG
ncbi:hypothetical protein [Streptomyces mayteni]